MSRPRKAPAGGAAVDESPIDPYLPSAGNRGYRVSRYELDLTYKVSSNHLTGRARIVASTTDERPHVSFDLASSLRVSKVTVNGRRPAKFAHRGGKLVVTFAEHLPIGDPLIVVVDYSGTPRPIRSPWGAVGWEELDEGSLVASQPNGASSWFPCDDHPAAKASYRITVTTDSPYTVVANGELRRTTRKSSRTTWVFEQADPMATYLATVQIGHYEQRRIHDGPVPLWVVHPPRLRDRVDRDFARQAQMLEVFERLFGPYPFEHYTAVVTDDDLEIPIEAQTISIFGANHIDGDRTEERLVAHEFAHQWFGNSLTLGQWRDIWLHEGFACYAEWLWSENSGGPSSDQCVAQAYRGLLAKPRDITIGDPGPQDMFDDRVYKRGAITLHALRVQLGDETFFTMLRDWTSEHRCGTVTSAQFVDHASRYGDTAVRPLFDAWLDQDALPPVPQRSGAPSAASARAIKAPAARPPLVRRIFRS